MKQLKFEMVDYQADDEGTPEQDKRPWRFEVEACAVNVGQDKLDSLTVIAYCPDGTKREVWIEISNGALVAHCSDPEHDEPLNVRIMADCITTDTDRENGEGITHG